MRKVSGPDPSDPPMVTDVSLLRDSSLIFSTLPEPPDAGWLARCLGVPFGVFSTGGKFEYRRELVRRRLLWLAARSLDVDDDIVEQRYCVIEDAQGRLVLLRR